MRGEAHDGFLSRRGKSFLADSNRSFLLTASPSQYCNTSAADYGNHVVAAIVTDKWLAFSAERGNDLRPMLRDGCKWCLCASRWKETFDAYKAGEISKDVVPK